MAPRSNLARSLRLPHTTLDLHAQTHIMGVLNVTPDSFSDGGLFLHPDEALDRAKHLVTSGASILDVGGESTRPGAPPVPEDEELRRVVPVIRLIRQHLPHIPISIDTTKAAVAAAAIEAGASIINDVTGLSNDPSLATLARSHDCALVIMHMRGTPQTMQQLCDYDDVVAEVRDHLLARAAWALRSGLDPDQIILDPGLGFSKDASQSTTLLAHTHTFASLGYPLLVGPSRKSFLGKITGRQLPAERVWATAAATTAAILGGAQLIRLHDVEVMRDVVHVAHALRASL
jgi:dihydropteroate synthase